MNNYHPGAGSAPSRKDTDQLTTRTADGESVDANDINTPKSKTHLYGNKVKKAAMCCTYTCFAVRVIVVHWYDVAAHVYHRMVVGRHIHILQILLIA